MWVVKTYSNTTLVKVKWKADIEEISAFTKFKYNTC